MTHRYIAPRWSLELASGWTAEPRVDSSLGERTEFVAITPETGDALLRLTVDERGLMAAEKWTERVADMNRAKRRRVTAAPCGDFRGWLVEFVSDDECLRGWVLRADSLPLDIVYRCNTSHAGRDDAAVGRMLGSLRLAVGGE